MVQLRMSTDSSPSNTRMETICDQKATLADGALKVIARDERPKSSLDESNQESNLKLKRCKHGRIIVKDLSKKKPVQQGDKDEEPQNSLSNNNNSSIKINNSPKETANDLQLTEVDSKVHTSAAKTSEENTLTQSTNAVDCASSKSETKSFIDVKRPEPREDSPRIDPHTRRRQSRSPPRHSRSSRNDHGGRSRTPTRRRQHSRSPSPRTPPPRTSRVSPHRRRRSISRSPRSRRDRSRSRTRSRSPRLSRRSPRRNRRRSPRRSKHSSDHRQSNRHSPRHRSPRRNRSRSRSRTRSKSPYKLSKASNRELCKSPDGYRRDKLAREPVREQGTSRRDLFDSPKQLSERQTLDSLDEVLPFQPTLGSTISSAESAQDTHKSNSINHSNSHTIPNNIPETANNTASPHRSTTSMTISSNDSVSSDIYDPEGPILPISPGDSPPLSPINRAANDTISNNKFLRIEKDDDEMPSSAVELNSQEKYLQKLNRQERVVEEVKIALKPYYQRRAISKDQYKDVLRRAVPKICHSKNGEINPVKIRSLVDAYVKKMKK